MRDEIIGHLVGIYENNERAMNFASALHCAGHADAADRVQAMFPIFRGDPIWKDGHDRPKETNPVCVQELDRAVLLKILAETLPHALFRFNDSGLLRSKYSAR